MSIPNTSATGGVLSPLGTLPFDDVALDAVFQTLITGITGIPGTLVFPRWQPTVPKQPEPSVTWCALGVLTVTPDDGPWLVYDAPSNTEYLWDHELIDVLVTFYGPNSQSNARLLRAGIEVPQNTESLKPYFIRYITSGPVRQIPELVNQQWIKRQDVSLQFRRKVIMNYGVQNVLIADVNLIDDTVINDTIIVPPGSPIQP